MTNGGEVSTTETASLSQSIATSACKIVPYDDINDVTMTCYLEQNGQRVVQFYDPDVEGVFKAEVCLVGNLRFHLCGELCLCVHIECVGPRDPVELRCDRVTLDPCRGVNQDKSCYKLEVRIPPKHLTAGECGTYCVFVATLTSFTPPCPDQRQRPGHICCYCRGPAVMVCRQPAH